MIKLQRNYFTPSPLPSPQGGGKIVERWRATGGERGKALFATALTRRLRSLGGVGEVSTGPLSVFWRAGVFAPLLSPDKSGKRRKMEGRRYPIVSAP